MDEINNLPDGILYVVTREIDNNNADSCDEGIERFGVTLFLSPVDLRTPA